MENIKLVKEIIQSNDFLTSIDLKDAYFAIPMCEIDQSYLCFSWENQFYRFTCLPFGLSSAPRIFTKVMKPVIATARSKGIRLVIFIDDILIMASSENESNEQTTFVVQLLEYLGFQINKGKSCLKPQTHSTYLGVEIDSKTMTINVPKSKIHKLKSEGTQILEKKVLTLRNLAKFIGMIIATFDAFPRGKLHFRKLESAKSNTLKNEYGNYDANIAVNQTIREETTWWLDIPCDDVKSSIKKPPITIVICTDASNTGWGAVSETDNSYTQGKWSKTQQQLHINMLELLAAQNALLTLCETLNNVHVLIKSDNSTAVSYISRMGGTVGPLNDLASKMFLWCIERNITLSATHIA